MSEPKPPFVRRVRLRNYKSIRQCDVSLGPLTLLVGPNGSGKSNFLDALRFVADSLESRIGQAIAQRGDMRSLSYRTAERGSPGFEIGLRVELPTGGLASYGFTVEEGGSRGFQIQEEHCAVRHAGRPEAKYQVRQGEVAFATVEPPPPASADLLYLPVASGFPEFRPLYDALARMTFFNINPERVKQGPYPRGGDILERDGDCAADVLRQILTTRPHVKERVDEYIRAILPRFDRIEVESLEEYVRRTNSALVGDAPLPASALRDEFRVSFVLHTDKGPIYLSPEQMSDGTLRAFGVLLAVFQSCDRPADMPISLVGIEEPEATLHPATAGVLFDALHEGSYFTQVLVTTHSAELLDIKDLDPESLLVVDAAEGETVIGPADEASLSVMRDRMYTAGELLEMDQLRPNPTPSHTAGADTSEKPLPLLPDSQ